MPNTNKPLEILTQIATKKTQEPLFQQLQIVNQRSKGLKTQN